MLRRDFLTAVVAALFLMTAGELGAAAPDKSPPVQTVRVVLPENAGPVLKNIGAVFARQVQQRCEAKVLVTGDAPLKVELAVRPGMGTEGFTIADGKDGTMRIVGNDERGVLYGVGKFLRTSRYDQGGFTPGAWRGTSLPQKPVRGIFFGTHFETFYIAAPVEKVQQYVEDLGLWGCNSVMVWDSLLKYDGFDDPKAVNLRNRLEAICRTARGIGLDIGLLIIANEGYKNCPASVRVPKNVARGNTFACQVCPSKPEGLKYILDSLSREFDWWAHLHPNDFCLWPYDPGGCDCPNCRPWGGNGFMKAGEPIAALARQKLPGAKIILSTWFFDGADLQGLTKRFTEQRPWADYIMAEGSCPNVAGLPVVGFPEISMWATNIWGGYGATVFPNHCQPQWNAVKDQSRGGFPYSEGIFEDIQKALFSQFYWNGRPAQQTLREYAAFEYSPAVVDEVMRVFAILEQNHLVMGSLSNKPQEMKPNNAEEAFEAIKRVDAKLTPQARRAWRWRQLYLRTLLDAERTKNHGLPNDRCQEAFAELIEIYHAQKAEAPIRPPLDPNFHTPSSR